ncbi:MAG: WD40/YVTN/BNR-like repeat-containing protein [Candidatus Dormibacteria bacterium]
MIILACAWMGLAPVLAAAAPSPDNTWVALAALPAPVEGPISALAVDPGSSQNLLVGTSDGSIYGSSDGGRSWRLNKKLAGHAITTIAFSPFTVGSVVAGAQGGGAYRSQDAGRTWTAQSGTQTLTVRAIAFGKDFTVAATDRGALLEPAGASVWSSVGLTQADLSAVAVCVVNDPSKVLAGGDSTTGSETLPLYQSSDGGMNWAPDQSAPPGSKIVAALAAGPVQPARNVRPVLMGTNQGLFQSDDDGLSWVSLNQGQLPVTDITDAAFVTANPNRFYVSSDGGGSTGGGLWSSSDSGSHFRDLKPPVSSVTALAVSSDQTPVVYVATLRPSDQRVALWAYRDAGGPPVAPINVGRTSSAAASGARVHASPGTSQGSLLSLVQGPQGPYLLVTAAALVALAVGLVGFLRRGRNF